MTGGKTAALLVGSRGRRLLRAGATMLALGSPVWLLALAVRQHLDPLIAFDERAVRAATELAGRCGLADLLVGVQAATQPVVVHALAAAVVLRIGRAGPRGRALWAFLTMMGSWGAGALAKLLVGRSRPALPEPLATAHGFSFPSGHALNATVAAGVLLVLLWPRMTSGQRRAGLAVAAVAVAVVGLNRVLLGVHFPSDVVGGVVLGCCLVAASWSGFSAPVPSAAQRSR